ncbi:MAG: formate--tetrahydrofolate ligase [Bacilli bacterium]|nr:formate--tetrahydrofolate ligase [Bacilli bacterium]
MLTDYEINKAHDKIEINKLLKKFRVVDSEIDNYGKYMAKINLSIFERLKNKKDGKLILVTAINPTPYGEGKSTTTIGLVDALNLVGKKAMGALREPSLGPVFGVKGGATGGGYAQIFPMEDINLHFTGDIHAITSANNLISATIDNVMFHGNELKIDPNKITWKRCIDLNDRALREVRVGLSSEKEVARKDYFNISVASEVMAMLCLSSSFEELRERINKTIVAYSLENKPITIKDLNITGSILALLKQAINPNIVQTLEKNLMVVHGGPFANIAHGCNSILGTKLALKLADYVVTEAGFGADLGAEKFLNIKCPLMGKSPSAVVLVATTKALKYHGGASDINKENIEALKSGLSNLEKHLENIKKFNLTCVVALNKLENDTEKEINILKQWAKEKEVAFAVSDVFAKGSEGGIDLANKVIENISNKKHKLTYKLEESLFKKIEKISKNIYGAKRVVYSKEAKEALLELDKSEFRNYNICMAKTPLSLTDDKTKIGRPTDFDISIKEIRIASGCNFVICLTGNIMTMPGLPKKGKLYEIDLDEFNNIIGIS